MLYGACLLNYPLRITLRVSVAIACLLLLAPIAAQALVIAAANSTCSVVKEIGQSYQKRQTNTIDIEYICKSSGRLAKGLKGRSIEADLYISANKKWMDFMVTNDMVHSSEIISPWGNQLVVATAADNPVIIHQWEQISAPEIKKILIGDPSTAPFGRYAKQAMVASDLWSQVRNRIETKKHITLLAKDLAAANQRTIGILFSTNLGTHLKSLVAIEPSLHQPIRYFMAPLRKSNNRTVVDAFLNYLEAQGGSIADRYGFLVSPGL